MYRINLGRLSRKQKIATTSGYRISSTSGFILLFVQILISLILLNRYLPGSFLISLDWFTGNQLLRVGLIVITLFLTLHFASAEKWKSLVLSEITIVLFLLEFFLTTPVFRLSPNPTEIHPLRVLTINIRNSSRLLVWPAYCKDFDIDIAAFQEVDESLLDNFFQQAKSMGYNSRYIGYYPQSKSGLLIISRGMIFENEAINARSAYESPVRSSLYVTTEIQNVMINILTVHLEPRGTPHSIKSYARAWKMRYMQSQVLREFIKQKQGYFLLLGDMNSTPTERSIRPLRTEMKDTWNESGFGFGATWHQDLPMFRIDYILYKNFSGAANPEIIPVRFSDHSGYKVELAW
ncbi:endonuclease/exonuclease/phosphatase family protein [Calditrichota bacterium]